MSEESNEPQTTNALAELFSGWRGPVTLLALVVGLFVVMQWVYPSRLPNPAELAACVQVYKTFMEHAQAGRYDEAYELTSEALRRRFDRQQFEEMVKKHPELRSSEQGFMGGCRMTSSRPPRRVEEYFDRKRPDGSMARVTVILVGEAEVWQVDDVRIEPKPR